MIEITDEAMCEIPHKLAIQFLLPRHYSGRIPQITFSYGYFVGGVLQAVCTFGKPANGYICENIAGASNSKRVYELNRLCREDGFHEPLSKFVAWCLKQLKPLNLIIVSYSDSAMNHHGYIYQACNFIYIGETKERTDIYSTGHSRNAKKPEVETIRKVRSAKFRYLYIAGDRRFKRQVLSNLKYPIINEYPKGDNSNYELGMVLKDEIVDMTGKVVATWNLEKGMKQNIKPIYQVEEQSLF